MCVAVRVLFTDRRGGVSESPFESLNVAAHVGDDPDAVAANRALVAARAGVPADRLVLLAGTSGGPVGSIDVTSPGEVSGLEALVTTTPDLAIGVTAADCVPVLLADEDAGVIGAAHAGRRGVQTHIVVDTVNRMTDMGAESNRLRVWIGPAICGRCYEVGEDVAAQTLAVAPAAESTTSWGTTALDLPSAVRAQLAACGVEAAHVASDDRCTREDPTLYSYRRDGRTGRQASVIVRGDDG